MYVWNNATLHPSLAPVRPFALATMIFLKDVQDGLKAMVLAYLISPYGIPLFATWLLGKIGDINQRLKSI